MSDCHVTFGVDIPLSEPVMEEVSNLLSKADEYDPYDGDSEVPPELAEVFSEFAEYQELGFQWHVRHGILSLGSDDSGNTEHLTELLCWILPKTEEVNYGFTYAMTGGGTCDGGAVRVFKDGSKVETEWMSADHWLASVMR